jgi:pectin methylesterase-like acyl-CoA thioesterase
VISDRQDAFWLDDDGNLVYAHDERGNRLPDFSHVGYRNGETAIPDVDVVVTLHPSPDGGDDTSRIQAALDRAGTVEPGPDGLRGAVLLKGGTYRIKGSLQMQRSGVVLRGEDGETLLVELGMARLRTNAR